MRVPLSWIRDFTPADAPIDALVAALNQLGLEVEGVEDPGREVLGVRVARILEVLPHPDADRLRLADVEFGDGTTRVVCGAPNIAVPHDQGSGAEKTYHVRTAHWLTAKSPMR